MINLRERDTSCLPRRLNERDGHFVRNVECLDQHGFVSSESDRIFHEKFGEIIKTNIVHKTLMIPLAARDATRLLYPAMQSGGVDQARGKSAVKMIAEWQAGRLVPKSHLRKMV